MVAMHDLDALPNNPLPSSPDAVKLTRAVVHKNLHFIEVGGLGCRTDEEIQLLMKIIGGVDLDSLAPIPEREIDNVRAISEMLTVKNAERADLALWVIDSWAGQVVGLDDVLRNITTTVKSTNAPTVVVTQPDQMVGVQDCYPTYRKAFVALGGARDYKRDFSSLLLIQDLISQAQPSLFGTN